jgi:imidazolonepropionase-like amidohydrolase
MIPKAACSHSSLKKWRAARINTLTPRKRRWSLNRFLLFLIALGATTAPLEAQTSKVMALRAGSLFDSNSGQLLRNQVVLIEGDRISEVGPAERVKVPDGAQVIDLGQATILPGLIDAHTHMFPTRIGDKQVDFLSTTMTYRTVIAVADTISTLRAGFTSVRDCGSHGNGSADADLRDAINRGFIEGPRMQVSTMPIQTSGEGHLGTWQAEIPNQYRIADSPWEARRAVREAIQSGADWIKVHADLYYRPDHNGSPFFIPTFTLEELKAITDEAHRRHKHVAIHTMAGEDLEDSIEAEGAGDSIEHAFALTERQADKMRQKGEYLDLTEWRYYDHPYFKFIEAKHAKNETMLESERVGRMAISRGVKIIFGTGVDSDATGPYPSGENAREFEFLVRDGMTPAQAIQSATKVDAEMLGWQNDVGSIEVGKYADIIAVAGNPLQDIKELTRVKFVMKGGRVIRNDLKVSPGRAE